MFALPRKSVMTKHHFSYLALGDSYTIGESVPLYDSFPYQVVQLLRKAGLHFHAPEIVAKTGWTSGELAEHILHTKLNEQYDFVSLLIGVNNQYRGLSADDFQTDLVFLLKKAQHLTGGHDSRIVLLSIPDWGATSFAADKDAVGIGKEIDQFNQVCESLAAQYKAHFINITADSRKAKNDNTLLATDQLHYSGKEHAVWAGKVAGFIRQVVQG